MSPQFTASAISPIIYRYGGTLFHYVHLLYLYRYHRAAKIDLRRCQICIEEKHGRHTHLLWTADLNSGASFIAGYSLKVEANGNPCEMQNGGIIEESK